MRVAYTDPIVADHNRSAQRRVHFINAVQRRIPEPISKEEATSQCESMEIGGWSTKRSIAHTAWLLQTRLREPCRALLRPGKAGGRTGGTKIALAWCWGSVTTDGRGRRKAQ